MSTKFPTRTKRPIEKKVKTFKLVNDGSQQTVNLYTSIIAETLSGFFLSGSILSTVTNQFAIALLVLVREGNSVNAIGLGNQNDTYKPEQNVLWSIGYDSGDPENPKHFADRMKVQRKLKEGDALFLVHDSEAAAGVIAGTISIFIKQ